MSMEYELAFLKALLLTILIEGIVLFVVLRTLFKKERVSTARVILTGIVASMTTLPYFWFIFPLFISSKIEFMLVSEIAAVIIESFIIWGFLRIGFLKSALLSFVCNLVSFLTGLLLHLA